MGNNHIHKSDQKCDQETLRAFSQIALARLCGSLKSDQSPLVCVTYSGATAINLEHNISKTCSLQWTRILLRPVLMVLQNLQMYQCIISKIALTYKYYCMHHSLCLVMISIGHTDLYTFDHLSLVHGQSEQNIKKCKILH